jgi:hypothetical protein
MIKQQLRTLPGPASYALPPVMGYENHDITRRRNPSYTFGNKTEESERRRPDPCYVKSGYTGFGKANVPVPTRKEKRVERVLVPTPGPASYYPERCPVMKGKRPPAYTFGVRMAKPAPGPNTYQIPPCFGYKIPNKASAPVHTIRGRPLERDHFRTPGPNKYTLPEMDIYKSRSPRHTITGRRE